MDDLGIGIVRFETTFLREILEELKDKIEIYSNSGESLCTIEGPEATLLIEQAVDMYMRSALIKFNEEQTPP
jgi:HEPN domain-containing protein